MAFSVATAAVAAVAAFGPSLSKPPIVFLTGMGGSILNYTDNAHDSNPVCGPNSPFKTVPQVIWPPVDKWPAPTGVTTSQCPVPRLLMEWHNDTQEWRALPGVQIRNGWEDKSNPERAMQEVLGQIGQMESIASLLQHGYVPGKTLFVAPYDWRYGPWQQVANHTDFWTELKALVEAAYAANGNSRVALVGHSQGTTTIQAFLYHMDRQWKDKHVRAGVYLMPVFSGVVGTMMATITGKAGLIDQMTQLPYEFELLPLISQFISRMAIAFWYFPRPGHDAHTWNDTETVVFTPSKNYSAFDMGELLQDIGMSSRVDGLNFLQSAGEPVMHSFDPPMTDTLVILGTGSSTPAAIKFPKDFDCRGGTLPCTQQNYTIIDGDGDGTVPSRSSRRAYQWEQPLTAAGYKFALHEHEGWEHTPAVSPNPAPELWEEVFDFLGNTQERPRGPSRRVPTSSGARRV